MMICICSERSQQLHAKRHTLSAGCEWPEPPEKGHFVYAAEGGAISCEESVVVEEWKL
jgi:hypothetical protein